MKEQVMLTSLEIAELYPTEDEDRRKDSLYKDVASAAVNAVVCTDAWIGRNTFSGADLVKKAVADTRASMRIALDMAAYSMMQRALYADAESGSPTELNRMHQLAELAKINPNLREA